MLKQTIRLTVAVAATATLAAGLAYAGESEQYENNDGGSGSCAGLPSHHALQTALESARDQANGGFNLDMWASIVNRDGIVCQVAFTGQNRGSQWPGSRVISAQKANTANSFSLPGLA